MKLTYLLRTQTFMHIGKYQKAEFLVKFMPTGNSIYTEVCFWLPWRLEMEFCFGFVLCVLSDSSLTLMESLIMIGSFLTQHLLSCTPACNFQKVRSGWIWNVDCLSFSRIFLILILKSLPESAELSCGFLVNSIYETHKLCQKCILSSFEHGYHSSTGPYLVILFSCNWVLIMVREE